VSPASAAIGAHEACRFFGQFNRESELGISPAVGSITSEGVYTAPWIVLRGLKIIVTAQVGSEHATASLEVSDNATWVSKSGNGDT
jgi:hypothetical protein